jgi:Concanavalin A-like lectin/glucanases superfamily
MQVTRRRVLHGVGCLGLTAMARVARTARAPAYRERILAKRPIAYWPLDEPQGSSARDLADGAIGTYRGGVVFGQRGPLHHEHAAVGLNGADAFVEIPNRAAFSQPTSGRGLTVEVWFRPDSLIFAGQTQDPYVHWLGKGEPGDYEWGFRFYSRNSSRPNRVSAYIWNAAPSAGGRNEGAGAYFEDVLLAGAWVHVVACYDPSDARNAGVAIYKNGMRRHGPESSRGARYSSYDIQPRPGPAPLRLGSRDQQSFLTGGLADVALYPRVLSEAEIRDNASA